MKTTIDQIATGNLLFLRTLILTPKHKMILSDAVGELMKNNDAAFQDLLTRIRNFTAWSIDNDPYGEKDFGSIVVENVKYFFKIDLYDPSWEYGFDMDEMPIEKCHRLLSIMEASEY